MSAEIPLRPTASHCVRDAVEKPENDCVPRPLLRGRSGRSRIRPRNVEIGQQHPGRSRRRNRPPETERT